MVLLLYAQPRARAVRHNWHVEPAGRARRSCSSISFSHPIPTPASRLFSLVQSPTISSFVHVDPQTHAPFSISSQIALQSTAMLLARDLQHILDQIYGRASSPTFLPLPPEAASPLLAASSFFLSTTSSSLPSGVRASPAPKSLSTPFPSH